MSSHSQSPAHDGTASGHLSGRHALVTGGGGGLGTAIALRLAKDGAAITLADIDADKMEPVAAQVRELGVPCETWQLDLSDVAAQSELTLEFDILVNNAGIQHVAPIHEFPVDRWELIQRLMVTSPFLLIRACLPHMYAGGYGRIVNISSAHGLRASEFKSAYVAAKHGLEGLSKVTALEGANKGVTSMCINPGYVWTPLVAAQVKDQAVAHNMSEDEVAEKVMLAAQPLKEFATPEAIAEAVAYCTNPYSSSVTGTNIVVDGAWTAR
ncbi:3-hydroxybutyrate dehydrogenase [Ornithinicoccus hortensis]|uniref:3-hydroxybutyrate dehydrogenase n=1 Tax=Ornithinicoccus hortensis TaxID=82346 RepID=A0A542YV97_9MICO|nr:3-hydroxybutyrate dehydrogenase [Ornithinicoccus hortensis]TQL51993.1 3-hydroxybutyrate dehydrogenase [Ornithinicoccus hortensis]